MYFLCDILTLGFIAIDILFV